MEFTFYNTSNQLTFSGDGMMYTYVGRAAQAGLAQAGTSNIFSASGKSTYTINWAGDILVVLPLKTNGHTALIDVSQSGSVWTITVHKANGAVDARGYDIQEYTEVYVFGAPPPGATSVFMVYDSTGTIPTGDLSRRPLIVKGLLSLTNNVSSNTWTPPQAIAAPGIIGAPMGFRWTSVRNSASWTNTTYGYAWILNANGSIDRVPYQTAISTDDGGVTPQTSVQPCLSIVTTVTGL